MKEGMYECLVLAMGPLPSTENFQSSWYSSSNKWNGINDQNLTLTTSSIEKENTLMCLKKFFEPSQEQTLLYSSWVYWFSTKEQQLQTHSKESLSDTSPQSSKNIRQIRTLVGTINFIKTTFPNGAAIMKPFANLTKKTQPWAWKQEQQQAAAKILTTVTDSTLCIYPNPTSH